MLHKCTVESGIPLPSRHGSVQLFTEPGAVGVPAVDVNTPVLDWMLAIPESRQGAALSFDLLKAYSGPSLTNEQVKTYVQLRLIQETHHKDSKTRLRALELLGKTGDAFSERKTITTQNPAPAEISAQLREKLLQLASKK